MLDIQCDGLDLCIVICEAGSENAVGSWDVIECDVSEPSDGVVGSSEGETVRHVELFAPERSGVFREGVTDDEVGSHHLCTSRGCAHPKRLVEIGLFETRRRVRGNSEPRRV